MRIGIVVAGMLIVGAGLGTLPARGDPQAAQYEQYEGLLMRPSAGQSASQPVRRRAARKKSPRPAASKPAQQPTRPDFTKEDQDQAAIPGLPDVRFWADSVEDFERALAPTKGPWLILSSGGEEGAYGAGFLNGWTASGTRPPFAVVTGVSTGALMAIYAFAGTEYDAALRDNYTKVSAGDIFEAGATPESLADTWPLAQLIAKRVTPELLAAIGEEHRRGRRLFVTTTNLDAGRAVVWNMGAIAAHGGDAAPKLFRDVLLASASVPGMFPPVYIEAEANGHRFREMHVDGGVNGPLFIAPEQYFAAGATRRLPARQLYVIVNGKLTPEFDVPLRSTASILGRSIVVALKMGARIQLANAYLAAERSGAEINLAYVDAGFDGKGRGLFDQDYMAALFDYGAAQGRSDTRFQNGSPFAWQRLPGTAGEDVPASK